MNRLLLLAPLMTALAVPATAQTLLSLSVTGAATAAPDEAVAQFEVQATNPDAAKAQETVNQLVTKALAAAHAVANVTITTGRYSTYKIMPDQQEKATFTAQQNLTLTQPAAGGVPDAAFTSLLAKLQSDGLLLVGLSGDLSPAGTEKLQRRAVHNALIQLRAEANSIAGDLHEKVGNLQSLSVNGGDNIVPPVGPRMMAMAAAAPQSAPDNITISARVSAKIEIKPES